MNILTNLNFPTALFYAWCLVPAISTFHTTSASACIWFVHVCTLTTHDNYDCLQHSNNSEGHLHEETSLIPSVIVFMIHKQQFWKAISPIWCDFASSTVINCVGAEWMRSQRYQVGLHRVDKFLSLCIFYCRGWLPFLALIMSTSVCYDFTLLFSTCSHILPSKNQYQMEAI